MQYLLLVYRDETRDAQATPTEQDARNAEYAAFGERAREFIRGGAAIDETTTATTVRVRDGQRLITDGPFAETKEQLGGFYIVDCANLDDALDLAVQLPHARLASIEVRPILEGA